MSHRDYLLKGYYREIEGEKKIKAAQIRNEDK
jgi:hypothetical protein